MHRLLILLSLICVLHGELRAEQMFKPIPRNAGVTANGLQASLTFVKNDFGPGESLLATWKFSNVSEKAASFSVDRGTWYLATIRIRRNGEVLKLSRSVDRKDLDIKAPIFKLEPGADKSFLLDLRAVDWDDPKWCDALGSYEVQVSLDQIQTPWTRFRVTAPGEKMPELTPDHAEKLRGLISQLGDADFALREQAHRQIRMVGKAAILQLQEAIAHERNTEIVERCKRLIQEITQPRPSLPPPLPVIVRPQPRPVPQPPLPPPDLEF